MKYIQELTNLGLKDKEAAVYLSCLELGPSPVQPIGRKAKVVRATTYVILESLMNMGLVTKYKVGKKTLFSAETPRQLLRLLEKQEEVIQEKQHNIEAILPQLQMLTKAAGDKPSVRYFEGQEGLVVMRREIIMYPRAGDTIYNFTPADHLNSVFPDEKDTVVSQRIAKKIFAKTLFTTTSESIKKRWLSSDISELNERRFVSPEKFPVPAGMTIYLDRIAIGSFTGKLFGVVIESQQMVNMMRALFELAWDGAETLDNQ
ncbi:MAG TPA: helix-turn-helix domain-containing protein [Candidatus Andersenbacteria bacterium]|nr:helix-turn-helix domain-containing protein [Candidatus Andersenbacteria bacterium]